MGSSGAMPETDTGGAALVASAAECVPPLPQDVVAEILRWVPDVDVAFLFRCAVVCKLWLRLLADPATVRRILPEHHAARSSQLLGFFVQRSRHGGAARREIPWYIPTGAPAFVPAPGSALGPQRRSLTSFVRDDDDGLLDHTSPLAARDGLLLLRIFPVATDGDALRLCVCNLLTGMLDMLPPLDAAWFDGQGIRGSAVLTAADHGAVTNRPADGYSTLFQVLIVGVRRKDGQMYVHRFCSAASASQSWCAAPTNCLCAAEHTRCRITSISRGSTHWLFYGGDEYNLSMHTLDVSVNTRATKLSPATIPHFMYRPWLGLSNRSRPSVLAAWWDHQLMIWTTDEDGDKGGTAVWRLAQAIQVSDLRLDRMSIICVAERSGFMLAVDHSDLDVAYVIDLQSESRTYTKWNRSLCHKTAVPFEINLPVFFMSRLGARL